MKILHPDVINLDDQEVYKNIFQAGKWMGIFQFTEKVHKVSQRERNRSRLLISLRLLLFTVPALFSAGVDNAYVQAVRDPLA